MGDDAYPPVTLSGNQSPAPFHIPPYFVPLGIKENNQLCQEYPEGYKPLPLSAIILP